MAHLSNPIPLVLNTTILWSNICVDPTKPWFQGVSFNKKRVMGLLAVVIDHCGPMNIPSNHHVWWSPSSKHLPIKMVMFRFAYMYTYIHIYICVYMCVWRKNRIRSNMGAYLKGMPSECQRTVKQRHGQSYTHQSQCHWKWIRPEFSNLRVSLLELHPLCLQHGQNTSVGHWSPWGQ